MKKRNSTFLATLALAALVLSSCNSSKKGEWSEADKSAFHKAIATVDLTSLGDKKEKWIECYLEKVEANYASFLSANGDEEGCKAFALICNDEVFSNGSVKGNWSELDKQTFKDDMAKEDLSSFGENKDKWIACYLSKCEANYASYYKANTDESGEVEKMALECVSEMGK